MNRVLKKREIALMVVLGAFLAALLYYRFVYSWYQESKILYNTSSLEDEILIQQSRAMQKKKMEAAIADSKEKNEGVVETYNNLKEEINALNDIFADAVDWNFSFGQAEASGTAVRRGITASFSAVSYEAAKEMLQKLHDCRLRCKIRNISISSTRLDKQKIRFNQKNLNKGPVQVSFSVTFYETLVGAETTDGLKMPRKNANANTNADVDVSALMNP